MGIGPVFWFHAVSLGEMKVAGFLSGKLRERLPAARFILTAATLTGHEEALRSAASGDIVLYPPVDYAWVCRRFLRKLKPDAVIVLETELWPNLFREVKRSGASLLLANGRISDRSLPRYRATRFFWRHVLGYSDAIFVQSEREAEHLRAIGAPAARVHIAGNLKFAIRPASSPLGETLLLRIREAGVEPVLVAGSTMPGEETILLKTFLALRQAFSNLWMILAPRHPERAGSIAAEIRAAGVPVQVRSEWQPSQPITPGIFLLDTAGELASLYPLAAAAFIGGTLVPTGGHNILEPAHFACPTVIGPSMENFRDVAAQFLDARAVIQVADVSELATALRQLLLHREDAKRLGQSARELVARQTSGCSLILDDLERMIAAKSGVASAALPVSPATVASAERWK